MQDVHLSIVFSILIAASKVSSKISMKVRLIRSPFPKPLVVLGNIQVRIKRVPVQDIKPAFILPIQKLSMP